MSWLTDLAPIFSGDVAVAGAMYALYPRLPAGWMNRALLYGGAMVQPGTAVIVEETGAAPGTRRPLSQEQA
jgi:hypothetical protein